MQDYKITNGMVFSVSEGLYLNKSVSLIDPGDEWVYHIFTYLYY